MPIRYLSGVNVDSNTLVVDAANDRVGIGTASPTYKFEVSDGTRTAVINPNASLDGIFIGVTQAKPLIFGTTDSERMRITSAGNVGINTTAPNAKLQIVKGSSGNVASFTSDASLISNYSGITLHSATVSGDDWYGSEIRSINTAGSPNFLNPRLGFFTQDYSTYLPAGRTEKMSILGNGNVGIGTTSPTTALHVIGLTQIVESGNTAFYGGNYVRVFSDQNFNIRNVSGTTIANISVNGASYFNGGNVGIGTTSPGRQLELAGAADAYIQLTRNNTGVQATLGFNTGVTNDWLIRTDDVDSNLKFYSYGTSGYALILARSTGAATFSSSVTASSLIKSGGTASQYLMADGSVSTLTNPVTGTGTTNYVPKFTGAGTIGNSQVFDNGTNVGIGTASPSSKLHVNGTVSADAAFADSSAVRILKPNGGSLVTTSPSVSGAIKITYPVGFTNTMHRVKVNVYEYSTNMAFTLFFGGYNYAPDSSWYNTFAYIVNNPIIDRNFTIRFGYDGAKLVVYVGELNSTWTYPQVFIEEVELGYGGQSNAWRDDSWAIAFEATAFQNVNSNLNIANSQATNWVRNGANAYYGLGNVGIGTTSPGYKLDVNGTISGGALTITSASQTAVFNDTRTNIHTDPASFLIKNTGDTSVTTLFHRLLDLDYAGDASGVTGTYARFLTGGTERAGLGLTSDKFTITTDSLERLTIDSTGNVGIGTTSPGELLEVVGNIRANVSNGGGFMLTGASASGLVRAGATGLALRTDTTDRLTIDNTGAATFSSSVTAVNYNSAIANKATLATASGAINVPYITSNVNEFQTIGFSYPSSVDNITRWGMALTATNFAAGLADLIFFTATTERLRIDNAGAATFSSSVTASSLIKSGGTSAQYLMADGSVSTLTNPVTGTGTTNYVPKFTSASAIGNSALQEVSGNLGLGVTPSAWQTDVKAIQIGDVGSNICANNGAYSGANNVWINNNSFQNSSVQDIYTRTATAGQYNIQGNTHIWRIAPSGTAGDAISFTQAMTLDASGNLLVGGTSPYGATITSYASATRSGGIGIRNSAGTAAGFFGTYAAGSGGGSTDITVESAGFMIFASGGSERMRITSAGNVGIGTTSPGGQLSIFDTNNSRAYQMSFGYETTETFRLGNNNATGKFTFTQLTNNNGFRFTSSAPNATGIIFDINTSQLAVNGDTGNVGIGTTGPATKLDVNGGINIANGNNLTWGGTYAAGIPTIVGYNAGTGGALYFYPNGSTSGEKMRLHASGNLSIGNTNDTYKLDVTGQGRLTHSAGVPALDIRASDTNFALMSIFGNQAGDVNWLLMSGYPAAGDFTIRQSDTVNALTLTKTTGAATFSSSVTASSLIKSGGTSAQYLMADGSVSTLTNPVTGTGTTNYVPKFTSSSAIGNSLIFDDGTNVGIGTASPAAKLEIYPGTITGASTQEVLRIDVPGDNIFSSATGYINFRGYDVSNAVQRDVAWIGTELVPNLSSSGWFGGNLIFRTTATGNAQTPQERVRITAAGNVGIGTTAPANTLQIGSVGTTGYSGNKFAIGDGTNVVVLHTAAVSYLTANGDIVVGAGGNTTNQLYVKSGGNVGIGTSSPASLLHIYGSNPRNFIQDSGTGYPYVQLNNSSGSFYLSIDSSSGSGFGSAYGRYLYSEGAYPIILVTNSAERLRITSAGNVGIGTTSPATRLQVSDSTATTQLSLTNSGGGGNATLGTDTSGNLFVGAPSNIYFKTFGGTDSTIIGTSGQIILNSSSNTTFTGTGNVGIGTTGPTEKLHVDGSTLITYNNSFQSTNSVGNKAILARVSPTSGIINYAEYATATNLNGFVIGSDDARVKGNITGDSLEFITNTSTRMTVLSSGNVGINTTTPGSTLHVVGDVLIQTGALGVGVNPDPTDGRIDASNDIVAFNSSDRRLKENITPIANALEKVRSLTGVEFDWKEETKKAHGHSGRDTGVIAQEVQAIMPTAVRTNNTGYLAVRYEKLIGLLIEGMKEQQAQIDEQQAQIDELKAQINDSSR